MRRGLVGARTKRSRYERNGPYRDGWRERSWLGFSSDFNNPAPWYFRTLETWTALLQRCGFDILECREPKAGGAVTPASVIWIVKARRSAQTR